MQKKKDFIINCILLAVVLLCLMDLSRVTYQKIKEAGATEQTQQDNDEPQVKMTEITADVPLAQQTDCLTFEGQTAVAAESIPWQTSCGLVEDETLGDCIFLTPNTALTFSCTPAAGQRLVLCAEIYPAMQTVSDGCSLQVQAFDENQNLLQDKTLQISAAAQEQSFEIDFADYENQPLRLRLTCGNGTQDNDDGDWLFMIQCVIK